jgi:hypothetical protein
MQVTLREWDSRALERAKKKGEARWGPRKIMHVERTAGVQMQI